MSEWVQKFPGTSPSARDAFGMVLDEARNKVVLFGGLAGPNYPADLSNETWEWDGSTWTRIITAHAPLPVEDFGMTYDPVRHVVVLFGGQRLNIGYEQQTWEYNGVDWTQIITANKPDKRAGPGMTYDRANGYVLLFGGAVSFPDTGFNDTWTYNGTNWTHLTPATTPSGFRASPGITYDERNGYVLMFGGYASGGGTFQDTWRWNGTDWAHLFPATTPTGRYGVGFAYSANCNAVLMFGGQTDAGGGTVVNQTYQWDGINWTLESPVLSPSARRYMGMCKSPLAGQIVMFGGTVASVFWDDVNDTWVTCIPPLVANPFVKVHFDF